MIEVKNFSARYPEKIIFENINFSLRDESFTALCGKNGSGKSTLLSLIDGIIPAGLKVSGDILVDGKSVFAMKRKEAVKKISYLVQKENPVWNFSVREFVETGLYSFFELSDLQKKNLTDSVLCKLGISDFAEKKIFNISGGEFQKCRIARCLVQQNDVLLFDEPVENLDLPFQIQLLKILKKIAKPSFEKSDGNQNDNENQPQNEIQNQNGKTVLFSIHDINLASLYADDFLIFSGTTVIQGTAKDVFSEEILGSAFCSNARIFLHPEFLKPQVLFF
ncbi:MAG: ABC transporter ATP-binding protein [Treponema sp.]